MSVVSVRQLHVGQGSSNTAIKKSYHGTYLVETDNPSDGPTLVENDYRVPPYGSYMVFGNSLDFTAICKTKSSERVSDTRLAWLVTVTWESLDQTSNQPNKDDDGNPTDDPGNWRDRWEWTATTFTGPVEQAVLISDTIPKIREANEIGPPVNASGEIFDPPAERDFTRRILRITKFRSAFPRGFDDYEDAINSDTFVINKTGLFITVAPYTAKMSAITGREQFWKATDGTEIPYVEVNYEIVIQKQGWRYSLVNRGTKRRCGPYDKDENGVGLTLADFPDDKPRARLVPIVDTDGNLITQPVLLDFEGQPLKPGSEPTLLEYAAYEEKPFAILRL